MGKTELVSIIIPVYNVEKYLKQCLDSVCSQTYRNLEILVIDDQSPDRSGEIAEEFAKKDSRIHVVHIQNRGAAGARNVGLDICTGEYIMFVDSDDWLEPNAVEVMMGAITENHCDIVLCQYWDEFVNRSERHAFMYETGIKTPQEFALGMIHCWEYIINWNKIYRREILQNFRFVEGRCIDDEFYTYQAVINSRKTVLIGDYLYHYRMRKSSAMRSSKHQKQRLRDQIDFVTERYAPLCKTYPELKTALLQHKLEVLLSVMRNGAEYQELFQDAKKQIKQEIIPILFNRAMDTNIRKSSLVFLLRSRSSFLKEHSTYLSETVQDAYFE